MLSESYILLIVLITSHYRVEAAEIGVSPRTIAAVEGSSVRIPCPQFRHVRDPGRVRLVLWFKDNDTNPIKSFDGRRRAQLVGLPVDLELSSADLQLTPVTRRHSGRYRCRVDADDDPTVVSWITLAVRDAPVTPSLIIYNQHRDEMGGSDVHIVEYSALKLRCCIIDGGDQTWHIAWTVRRPTEPEVPLTSETDRESSEQRLELNVTRADDSAALVCRAGTTAGEKLSAVVTLHVTYGPDAASLHCEQNATAGHKVTCSCHVLPALPGYRVTWLWGTTGVSSETQHPLRGEGPSQLTGVTSYRVTRLTSRHDDGRPVTCEATNPVSGQRRSATVTLAVLYAPELVLSGPSADLTEGDDAHFSCFVRAMPPAQFTLWLHNGRQLVSSERVVAGPQLLIVRNLTSENTGQYSCFTNNTLGGALSNIVHLRLKYAPVCRLRATRRRHAALHRAAFISCRVRAQPRPSVFRWEFQPAAGGETRTLPRSAHSDKGGSSVLRWTPTAATDYGRLLCRATNELGRQQQPCRFDITPPEEPGPVQNCTVSMSEAVISCTRGAFKGLTPRYTLWLYGPDEKLLANWTEDSPRFIVPMSSLPGGAEYRAEVVAETSAGRSEPAQLRFWPHPSAGPHTENRQFSVNSWVLGSAIFALLAVVTLVIVSVHVRCHCTPSSGVGSCQSSPGRPELTQQRSFSAPQPIYAEVQRRRSRPRPQQPALPPRPSGSGWNPPQPPRSRTPQPPRSRTPQPPRSRTPQPAALRSLSRSRTPQSPEYRDASGGRDGGRLLQPPVSDWCSPADRSRTLQPPRRRPGAPRRRSLPTPPATTAAVRGRSLQPDDTPPRARPQRDAPLTQALNRRRTAHRLPDPGLAGETPFQVHLQPPTPASTMSTVSTESVVDDLP